MIGPNGLGKLGSGFIHYDQKLTLDALEKGEIESIRVSQKLPVDQIAAFALQEGFLQEGLKKFPDPRKLWEVPIEVLLLPQILQRLHDEHSLLLAPYMLNSSDLITKLGYNVRILNDGFNQKNKYPRQTAFHGETLKHLLLKMKPDKLITWFNQQWLPIWRANCTSSYHPTFPDSESLLGSCPRHIIS